MTEFENLDISTARECLLNKEFSSLELTNFFIERIEKSNLNCFITNTFENAIEMAKESDRRISRNDGTRILEGIPIGMKDLFCTKGIRTTAGSKILENFMGENILHNFGYGAATFTNNKIYKHHAIPYWPHNGIFFSLIVFGEKEFMGIQFYIGAGIILLGVIGNIVFKYKKTP